MTILVSSVVGVELEPQQQPHPVPERLEKAVFVGRAEKQGEIGEGEAVEGLAAPDDDLAFVQCQVQGGLVDFREFMHLVDEDHFACRQHPRAGHSGRRCS